MLLPAPSPDAPAELIDPVPPAANPVPFNKPPFADSSLRHMFEALASGRHGGDGPFTRRCERFFQNALGVPRALLTTSCTHALEICGLLLNLRPGDEVIVPSYAFVSTARAFALRGVKIRFADIRRDTLNLDPAQLEPLITPRTRALVALHYGGVACDMDAILSVAQRRGVHVIEDNAHGLFAKYRGRWLGTLGTLATLSFHETKNLSCGEGGALLVNDPSDVDRAEIIREQGTDRDDSFRGRSSSSSWIEVGSSYTPSDILGAMLLGQLELAEEIQRRRQHLWNTYDASLLGWSKENGVQTPFVPEDCEQSYHLYYLLLPSPEARNGFLDHLRRHQIQAASHYLPLHRSRVGQTHGARMDACPVSDFVSERLVRLPLFHTLTQDEQWRVIDAVTTFRP